MKRILITGANSYVGTSFEKWLSQWPEEYHVDTIDMIDGTWRDKSFAGYDAVFHVAGIAHVKETKKNEHLYYEINRDLAVETARKAKTEGVSQFIFMSSMSVYGMDSGVITKDTEPHPKSNYGKSKLQAEREIEKLANDNFILTVLRPPMIYGKGCKGNYAKLSKFAKWTPVFLNIDNKRSMIYMDNLSEFIKIVINKKVNGVLMPQNNNYSNTSELVKIIAHIHGKKILFIKNIGWLLEIAKYISKTINKIFSNLYYDINISEYNYCMISLKDSIELIERQDSEKNIICSKS